MKGVVDDTHVATASSQHHRSTGTDARDRQRRDAAAVDAIGSPTSAGSGQRIVTALEQTRRVVATAYVRQFGDARSVALVERLAEENARLMAKTEGMPCTELARSGRYVFGRTVGALLLGSGALLLVYLASVQ